MSSDQPRNEQGQFAPIAGTQAVQPDWATESPQEPAEAPQEAAEQPTEAAAPAEPNPWERYEPVIGNRDPDAVREAVSIRDGLASPQLRAQTLEAQLRAGGELPEGMTMEDAIHAIRREAEQRQAPPANPFDPQPQQQPQPFPPQQQPYAPQEQYQPDQYQGAYEEPGLMTPEEMQQAVQQVARSEAQQMLDSRFQELEQRQARQALDDNLDGQVSRLQQATGINDQMAQQIRGIAVGEILQERVQSQEQLDGLIQSTYNTLRAGFEAGIGQQVAQSQANMPQTTTPQGGQEAPIERPKNLKEAARMWAESEGPGAPS